jgi:hypothetical protein
MKVALQNRLHDIPVAYTDLTTAQLVWSYEEDRQNMSPYQQQTLRARSAENTVTKP